MLILSLPLELLEHICDISATEIVRHHVRALLRATCKDLRLDLIPEAQSNWDQTLRAIVWVRYRRDIIWLIENKLSTPKNVINIAAAGADCIETIEAARSRSIQEYTGEEIMWAAKYGNIFSLRYLHEKFLEECGEPMIWDPKTCKAAASSGHLDCLVYAHLAGAKLRECAAIAAAKNGHMDCLQYVHTNGCHWTELTCEAAAGTGNIDCLRYAHENGCPWDENTCTSAAQNGHLHCLIYARENACPWDARTAEFAAMFGHLDCLEYALRSVWLMNNSWMVCAYAAGKGHLACLKLALEAGCPRNTNIIKSAAVGGHIDCLIYARENGCPWYDRTCHLAAFHKHIDCVRYARDNGSPDADSFNQKKYRRR